jgi:tripartite-type tricarboxylate transporter receptor subunit TctC
MPMRWLNRLVALSLAVLLPAVAAAADPWPSKPVKIIVPFAAGGATDVVARLLAQKLNEEWNQAVVVEDRAGAGGNIGADAVANSVPVKDLREFIAYVKAHPGQVNFGSAGVGTQTHLAAENFAYAAALDMTHVPYKGEAAALTDLVGGQIHMVTPNLGGAINLIKGGKIRALAVTSRERAAELPDVPAAAEVIPGFENAGWFGLMAPAGTPKEVVDKVYRDSAKILQSDAFKVALAKQGMVPVGNSPADFQAAIKEETGRWAKVIRERHLQAH